MSDDTLRQDDDWTGSRPEGPGSVIGLYTLRQRVGEGGFGDVWEAEQFEPVHRKVALKILKQGMDTREVVARFELERQALAVMEHPHIARVFDAGATAGGRPYFVMEYVEGEPITTFCDQRALTIEDRLRLFEQVCAAVQHAHTKGVIHRDLKPGNVLVSAHDGQPYAKVIDFGIAKAVTGELSEHTHATRMGQVMGTPRYMSPEQASGNTDIDTRTDIYSLGVILYELLTGSTPVERSRIEAVSIAETQRLICEVDPPPPSNRLRKSMTATASAGFHASQARTLAYRVRGELDWIAMKALEKDRSRRYETANALAMDVQRHLDGLPVLAAPASRVYRMRKFVRRNKIAVAAGVVVAASLLAGIVAFAWQARIAGQQARLAEQRASDLQKVSDFQARMLGKIDPSSIGKSLSDDVVAKYATALARTHLSAAQRADLASRFGQEWERVNATDAATGLIDRTILRPAVAEVSHEFKTQPLVAASLRQAIADSYSALGMYDQALPLQKLAVHDRQRLLGDEDPRTLDAMEKLGVLLYQHDSSSDTAELLFRKVLALRKRISGVNDPETISVLLDLGAALDGEGKLEQAEPFLLAAADTGRRVLGTNHKTTISAISTLGGLYLDMGEPKRATALLEEALTDSRRALGEDDSQTLSLINDLGTAAMQNSQPAKAESYFRQAWQLHRKLQGEDHPDTIGSMANLGGVLMVEGKIDAAIPLLTEVVDKSRRVLGERDQTTLLAMASLGKALLGRHRAAQVESLLAPSVDDARKALSEASPVQFGLYMLVLGMAQAAQHEFQPAESALLEAHGSFDKASGPRNGTLAVLCATAIADLYHAWDKADPGKGHAAQGAHWKQVLATLTAASASPPTKK